MMRRNALLLALTVTVASGIGFAAGRMLSVDMATSTTSVRASESVNSSLTLEESANQALDKPVIGIASLTSDTYVRAVRDCGGIPVVLPNADGSVEEIDEYLQLLDGLIMPGGADIPPSEYGEELHPTAKLLNDDRYRFEKAMITAWIKQTDKPLLGICLGSQWVNVAHGGSLVQDIPSEFGGHPKGVSHMVKLEPDSRLSEIFGQTEFEVNSLHHQAVRDVGDGLRIVARSPDGIIEATETTDPDRFLIGVQWHPEKLMPENKLQEKLIHAFVEAAVKGKE